MTVPPLTRPTSAAMRTTARCSDAPAKTLVRVSFWDTSATVPLKLAVMPGMICRGAT